MGAGSCFTTRPTKHFNFLCAVVPPEERTAGERWDGYLGGKDGMDIAEEEVGWVFGRRRWDGYCRGKGGMGIWELKVGWVFGRRRWDRYFRGEGGMVFWEEKAGWLFGRKR